MNIFIVVLVFIFMAGYYFIDTPSQQIGLHTLEHALARSELQSITECTAAAHTAALKGIDADLECVKRYNIVSENYCTNERDMVVKCDAVARNNSAKTGFMITTADQISVSDTNAMLEILEKLYPSAPSFGIVAARDKSVFILGAGGMNELPAMIATAADLSVGQLAYVTQYSIRPPVQLADINATENIICGRNQLKVFRFNKWECADRNIKKPCAGDTVWDFDAEKCVANTSSKPLCSTGQTAVMVDDSWECVSPQQNRECPENMMARLDYSTMEWVCVTNPLNIKSTKKCDNAAVVSTGAVGITTRTRATSCNDCEMMVTDPETCITACVPDASKVTQPACYARASECSGSHRAFYFGFPENDAYIAKATLNIPALADARIPHDAAHSQNRKFNCLDCGDRRINSAKSIYPYVAVCE